MKLGAAVNNAPVGAATVSIGHFMHGRHTAPCPPQPQLRTHSLVLEFEHLCQIFVHAFQPQPLPIPFNLAPKKSCHVEIPTAARTHLQCLSRSDTEPLEEPYWISVVPSKRLIPCDNSNHKTDQDPAPIPDRTPKLDTTWLPAASTLHSCRPTTSSSLCSERPPW